MKPLFITFEGGEGSGKSTQAKLFHNFFIEKYGPAILTREPGGVDVSEQIRNVLLNPKNKMIPLTELFLFEAARSQFVYEVLTPNLEKGHTIICDRFYDSTTAYQGFAGNLPLPYIFQLNDLASQGKHPNLTFIIDIDPKKGLENAVKRGKLSRFDEKNLDYHTRVNQGFLEIARQNPQRCILIPYQKGIKNVQESIRTEFAKRYL